MFQREFLIISSLAAALFLVVAGVGWFAVHQLHETSRMLVVDTLPGLVNSGLAEERINDNRRMMRDLLNSPTSAERALLINQIKNNGTENLWLDYSNTILEPEDRKNYEVLMGARSNYLQSCDQFMILVAAGKIDVAATLFNGDVTRLFLDYNLAAKRVFDYNVQQGISRGKSLLSTACYAPWIIAGICVLVFGFGLMLGMRSALNCRK